MAVRDWISRARDDWALVAIVFLVLAVVAIWLFDPFDACTSEWRVTTYSDFTGKVTETCVAGP
jgi:hypothetical protein